MNSSFIPYTADATSESHIGILSSIGAGLIFSGIMCFICQVHYQKKCPHCNMTVDKHELKEHLLQHERQAAEDPINHMEIPIMRD
jgi:hypothetical protein